MTGDPTPEQVQAVHDALTDIFGMHGGWVLALERYDESTGEPELGTLVSEDSTPWAQYGMATALADYVSIPFRRDEDEP